MKTKQVWLNIETGEFSNSWDKEEHDMSDMAKIDGRGNWKLIEYTVPNDEDWEFSQPMRLA